MTVLHVITGFLLVAGACFVLLAALGLLRLPDVLARMQATSKATTLGLASIMAAAALHAGTADAVVRVVVIVLFTFMTAPIGAHVIGRAAYRTNGGPWRGLVVDDMAAAQVVAAPIAATGRAARRTVGTPRVLVCSDDERARRVVARAGLERQFDPAATDLLELPSTAAPDPPRDWSRDALERLRAGGHALVLVDASEARPIPSAALRSLIRQSPVPLWISGERAPGQGIVLAAMDAPADPRRARAARDLLQDAAVLARSLGREWHAVHVWSPFGADFLQRRTTEAELEEYVAAEEMRARSRVKKMLASAAVHPAPRALHVRHGKRVDVIAELARDLPADLLVLGTRGRRWQLTAALMPPLAEVVLPRVRCAMLVIGPTAHLGWIDAEDHIQAGARSQDVRA